ncbi:hypothetical protein ACFYWX_06495 [Streptomyces sp. NPDC002888]|uniref:hypothetical protein n=1 Tax=Streptomyces sp. NPDC002888 TaxID=3364668 RepID=UPI00367E3B0D
MQTLPHVKEPTAADAGRFRAAWRAAHEPAAGVSRRMRSVAYAVPLAVLPSSIWRLPAVFDAGAGPGEKAYVILLSVVSEALAFTAVGLIARWGEVFPRWTPFLRGRRVPTTAAVVPAAIGATILTLGTLLTLVTQLMGTTIRGDDLPAGSPSEVGGWETAWFCVCYAPLLLWGPLLAVLTVAYSKRRRAPRTVLAAA